MANEQKHVILWRRSSVWPYDEKLYRHGSWTNEPNDATQFSFEDANRTLEAVKVDHPDANLTVQRYPYSLTGD